MSPSPIVTAIDMGYGHLRPARTLADAFGVDVVRVDVPPIASTEEQRVWQRIRTAYERTTRWTGLPLVGGALRGVVERVTAIPHLHPHRDQSAPDFAVRRMHRWIEEGLGSGVIEHARSRGAPLVSTYFAPALAADAAGLERVFCVVTDSDLHRIWAPRDPARSHIHYLVPSQRALRRLRAYGVPRAHIHVTGFPLPRALLGDDSLSTLKRDLAGRLVRLDPKRALRDASPEELRLFLGELPDDQHGLAPRITFAVGGAGAQTEIAERFVPALADDLRRGRWRLTLVAGVRREVADRFRSLLAEHGLDGLPPDRVDVLCADDHDGYFAAFDQLLRETDVLWTKPSEVSFYGALGLAIVIAPPVGVHESYNRRWLREHGAGLKQRDPRYAQQWLKEWLEDGLLAGAAWSGFVRLPKFGLHRIQRLVAGSAVGHNGVALRR